MVNRTTSLPEARIGANRFVNKPLGARHRNRQRKPLGQPGRDRGGVGAAGAVSMRRGHARRGEFVPLGAVEQQVDGVAFQVSAFDEYRPRAQFPQAAGGTAHVFQRSDRRYR